MLRFCVQPSSTGAVWRRSGICRIFSSQHLAPGVWSSPSQCGWRHCLSVLLGNVCEYCICWGAAGEGAWYLQKKKKIVAHLLLCCHGSDWIPLGLLDFLISRLSVTLTADIHQDSVFWLERSSGTELEFSRNSQMIYILDPVMTHMWSCVILNGSVFIVCQRGPLLLPNKACVLYAFGDHFNLCGNMKFWCQNESFLWECYFVCVLWYIESKELFLWVKNYLNFSKKKTPQIHALFIILYCCLFQTC